MDFGDRFDNPFSVALQSRPRRPALRSAVRVFLLACLGFGCSLAVTSQTQSWLLHRLTRDLDKLPTAEKQTRLAEIAELGPQATPILTQSLLDPHEDVARTAHELLQQSQNRWSVLEADERERRHLALVQSLSAIALELPEERTGWATNLLHQTLMTTVDRPQQDSRHLHREAARVLDMLSLSGRANSRPLDSVAAATESETESNPDFDGPRRLEIRVMPLPVEQSRAADQWTQWPPANEMRPETMTAKVLRGDVKLQPVQPQDNVHLSSIADQAPSLASATVAATPAAVSAPPSEAVGSVEIQPTAHLVESPLETYDDPSVMSWLASEHVALRDQAAAELSRRGYGPSDLNLARQLTSGDTTTRLELVNELSRQSDRDPRPWLLLLLRDAHRDVRLRAVSTLATMNDPSIMRQLNQHLADEQDPTVAARIRRVLKLR
jgi:hypothetical protein